MNMPNDFSRQVERHDMVDIQLVAEGVDQPAILFFQPSDKFHGIGSFLSGNLKMRLETIRCLLVMSKQFPNHLLLHL